MPDCKIFTTSGELILVFTPRAGMKIGRSSSCDLSLKGFCDDTVSREQFVIEKRKEGLTIKNIGHSHLYNNGNRIEEMTLLEGIVLRFSAYVLTVGSKSGPSPFEMNWETPTENNQRRAVLWYGVNTLGSSMDNYVVIRNQDIERLHAKVTVNQEDQVFIEPSGMGRFISVNQVELESGVIEIKEGDEILLGDETYVNLIRGIRKKNVLSAAEIAGTGMGSVNQSEVVKMARTPFGVIIAVLLVILLILLLFILFAQSIYELLFA